MTDDKLNDLLSDMDTPPIDKNAKKRAMNLAMAEFVQHKKEKNQQEEQQNSDTGTSENNQNSHQGFWFWVRPISNLLNASRKNLMMTLNNKLFYSGVATVSVAVMGTLLFQQTYKPSVDLSSTILHEQSVGLSEEIALQKRDDYQGQAIVIDKQEILTEAKSPAKPASPAPQSSIAIKENNLASTSIPSPSANEADAIISAPAPSIVLEDRSRLQSPALGASENKSDLVTTKSFAQEKAKAAKSLTPVEAEIAPDIIAQQTYQNEGRDRFESVEINPIKLVSEEPVSTFSIDVDTASYSFVRRQLNHGVLPQKDAVRIEEMINYFDYAYPLPESKSQPFKSSVVVHPSPWNPGKQLIHIGVKGYDIAPTQQPRSNLVLLLDVSGSMNSPDKLPLVKQSMSMLLNSLHPDDTIGIVVYAGAAGQVLEPTPVKEKQTILNALNRLNAGGSTAGGEGIKLAYQLAESNFDKTAVNRIILATDGDFNVGITNQEELKGFVERKREKGIFLSVLGFGQGNYNDHMMQKLAQNGNGIAAYIDSMSEAQKVLINEATSTLFPIAKDVKIQVEFNPNTVSEYRLIGYETRHLNREDFNNDAVDAGDIGAGHTVTAMYEITPKNSEAKPSIDPLRYSNNNEKEILEDKQASLRNEYGFLKIRYKLPNEDTSKLITKTINMEGELQNNKVDKEIQFATAVAGFSQLLKGGKYTGNYNYDNVINSAQASKGEDKFGYRTEFIQLVRKAKTAQAIR